MKFWIIYESLYDIFLSMKIVKFSLTKLKLLRESIYVTVTL